MPIGFHFGSSYNKIQYYYILVVLFNSTNRIEPTAEEGSSIHCSSTVKCLAPCLNQGE